MLDVGEELHLCIQFNPAYKKDLNSRVAKRVLRMSFMEHPHKEKITVRGEVYFPNLDLESEAVDFGCIINHTEQELHMEMTNCSPIPAQYHWSFLMDHELNTIRCVHHPCAAPAWTCSSLVLEWLLLSSPHQHSARGHIPLRSCSCRHLSLPLQVHDHSSVVSQVQALTT